MKGSHLALVLSLVWFLLVAVSPAAGQSVEARRANSSETAQATTDKDRITAQELKSKLDAKADIVIIDARDGRSWIGSAVKIKGAIHLTLSQLDEQLNDLPKDKEIVIYCT